jgi:hypothetical protein
MNPATDHAPQQGPTLVTPSTEEQAPKPPKPTRVLPSERASFFKQLDVLRAYAAASNGGAKSCLLAEVADVVKTHANTISNLNPFYTATGLIQRDGAGFKPNEDVVAFYRAHEWAADTAAHKLAPTLRTQWFFDALAPHLSFGPIDEEKALGILADASGAAVEYKQNVKLIVEYLVAANIVQRDGGQIKLVKSATQQGRASEQSEAHSSTQQRSEPPPSPPPAAGGASGRIQVNVSIDVDMTQIAGWQPERISAFFAGVAQVISAKGGS